MERWRGSGAGKRLDLVQSCRDRVKFWVSVVNNNTQYALKQLWDE